MSKDYNIVYINSEINELYGIIEVTQYFKNTQNNPIEL